MKADIAVPLILHLTISWTDPLCHLCARGWLDHYLKSQNQEVHCLQEAAEPIKLWRQAYQFSKCAKLQNNE